MSILRHFSNFILQGRIQACATAFVLTYIPVIGSISVLIAGLVTLRKGALEGGLVFLAATLPYLLSYCAGLSSANIALDLTLTAVLMFIASNCIIWLFAIILKRYSSWGFILDCATMIGITIIVIVHILNPNIKDWWGMELTGYFNKTTAMMREIQPNADKVPLDIQMQVINTIKIYATGLLIASIMFNALLQLLLARWWQAIIFNPGELRKELLHIRLSYIAGILFLIFYPLSSWGNNIAIDVMPILYIVFSVTGLSILHYLLAAKKTFLGLVLLYAGVLGIMFLLPRGILLIALLFSIIAFFDIGLDFRKRFID